MVLWEFNIEQPIRIVQKTNIKIDAIFKGGLVSSQSKTVFNGYQHSLILLAAW
jgi:hypothetical protein